MYNENIRIMATLKHGNRVSLDWYDMDSSDLCDCLITENDLAWYILESIAEDDLLKDAVSITAESVIKADGKELSRMNVTVR